MLPACQDALNKFWKCFKTVSSVKDAFKKFDAEGVDTLFILGDKDNNGQIDFSEFAEIMIPSAPERIAKLKKCFRNRSEIESAFRRFDTNKDGAISFSELKSGLGSCGILFTEQEVETVLPLLTEMVMVKSVYLNLFSFSAAQVDLHPTPFPNSLISASNKHSTSLTQTKMVLSHIQSCR